MKKSKSGMGKKSIIKPIALGAVMIWGIFLLLSLIMTAILFSGEDPTSKPALFSIIAFILSGALATLINKRIFKSYALNTPMLSALATAILYLSISAVICGGIKIGALISAACFITMTALLSLSKPKKARRRAR